MFWAAAETSERIQWSEPARSFTGFLQRMPKHYNCESIPRNSFAKRIQDNGGSNVRLYMQKKNYTERTWVMVITFKQIKPFPSHSSWGSMMDGCSIVYGALRVLEISSPSRKCLRLKIKIKMYYSLRCDTFTRILQESNRISSVGFNIGQHKYRPTFFISILFLLSACDFG